MSLCGSEGTEEMERELKQDKERTGKVCALQRAQALEAPPKEWTQGS